MIRRDYVYVALCVACAAASIVSAQTVVERRAPAPAAGPASAPVRTTPEVTWSGRAAGDAGMAGLWVQETLDGSSSAPADTALWANHIGVSDTLRTAHPSTMLDALNVQSTVLKGASGSRNALHGHMAVEASATGVTPGTSFPAYVSGFFTTRSAYPLGGRGTSYAASSGSLFGINPNVLAAPGATNLYGIVGAEIDVTAQAGSSMAQKLGLSIIQAGDSTVSGAQDDVALNIINTRGAVGWRQGIAFGNSGAYWPIAPNGTLIGGQAGQSGPGAARAGYGIDWSGIRFAGAAIRVPGLVVDGAGHLTQSGSGVPGYVAPTLGGCGAGAAIRGSDNAGTVTLGRGVTACTVRFGRAWQDTPHCVLTPRGTTTPGALAIVADSTIGITVHAAAMPSFTYQCTG